jgi:thioredoxin 1
MRSGAAALPELEVAARHCYNIGGMTNLTPLQDVDSLDAAIEESRERPVLLFKHSRYCGVSCEALDELQSHIDSRAEGGAAYKVITVQTHRPLSDAVAKRFGIRHETPQAILLHGGKVVWNASHFRITATQLDQVLAQYPAHEPRAVSSEPS